MRFNRSSRSSQTGCVLFHCFPRSRASAIVSKDLASVIAAMEDREPKGRADLTNTAYAPVCTRGGETVSQGVGWGFLSEIGRNGGGGVKRLNAGCPRIRPMVRVPSRSSATRRLLRKPLSAAGQGGGRSFSAVMKRAFPFCFGEGINPICRRNRVADALDAGDELLQVMAGGDGQRQVGGEAGFSIAAGGDEHDGLVASEMASPSWWSTSRQMRSCSL